MGYSDLDIAFTPEKGLRFCFPAALFAALRLQRALWSELRDLFPLQQSCVAWSVEEVIIIAICRKEFFSFVFFAEVELCVARSVRNGISLSSAAQHARGCVFNVWISKRLRIRQRNADTLKWKKVKDLVRVSSTSHICA
ncbi:unnamed protein product [Sphagnum balticum]